MAANRVLIVDDNKLMRLLIRTSIKSLECEVYEASDGEEALRVFGECRPDVVLLDVVMPRLSGFEVLARLRAVDDTQCRIVMLTAEAADSSHALASDHGADAYIDKPFDHAELRDLVGRLLDA